MLLLCVCSHLSNHFPLELYLIRLLHCVMLLYRIRNDAGCVDVPWVVFVDGEEAQVLLFQCGLLCFMDAYLFEQSGWAADWTSPSCWSL